MQKLTDFVSRLTRGNWQMIPSQTVDSLYADIERLEKHLTPPSTHRLQAKAKLAEMQKFIDLAG